MTRPAKKRIGLLVPAPNTAMEDDFAYLMPTLMRLHVNRMHAGSVRPPATPVDALRAMGRQAVEAARVLAMAPVDVIAFGCTSGSFLDGLGYDEYIIQRLKAASGGVKTVATSKAVIDALTALGVRRIAACSPYEDERNERLIKYYSDAGFEIVSFDAVRPDAPERCSFPDINNAPDGVAFELARSVDRPEAEAIFISCTAFRGAVEAIDDLERLCGKPVVTSNQATFWACMRAIDVNERIDGAGVLLATPTMTAGDLAIVR
jgi:maleate cis-trans isomerase